MSTHYASCHFTWEKDRLYLVDKFLIEVVPFKEYPGMFKLRWADGTLSKDFYNLTWARDNCIKVMLNEFNGTKDQPYNLQETAP